MQDSWKVNPKLTVLYGVRYDVFTPFTEAHNRISNFDFPEALTSHPCKRNPRTEDRKRERCRRTGRTFRPITPMSLRALVSRCR